MAPNSLSASNQYSWSLKITNLFENTIISLQPQSFHWCYSEQRESKNVLACWNEFLFLSGPLNDYLSSTLYLQSSNLQRDELNYSICQNGSLVIKSY